MDVYDSRLGKWKLTAYSPYGCYEDHLKKDCRINHWYFDRIKEDKNRNYFVYKMHETKIGEECTEEEVEKHFMGYGFFELHRWVLKKNYESPKEEEWKVLKNLSCNWDYI